MGVLTLHVGADAGDRKEVSTCSDNAQTFIVKQLGGDGTSGQIEIQWSSWKQTYDGVTRRLSLMLVQATT